MENVSIEYGGGLFALAKEEGLLEEFSQSLKMLSSIFKENDAYMRMMNSHQIPKEEKHSLLTDAFRGNVHPYIFNFLLMMVDKGYFSFVPDSFSHFEKLWMKEQGVIEALVESAVPLTSKQLSQIKTSIEERTKKKVILKSKVDSTLMIGLRVFADGELFENSAKSRFDEIDKLLQSSITTD